MKRRFILFLILFSFLGLSKVSFAQAPVPEDLPAVGMNEYSDEYKVD